MAKPRKTTITTRLCETTPTQRLRVYDDQCPGFFVSITPKGGAVFNFKYWDRILCKQVTIWLGKFDREHMPIEKARATAWDLKGRVGAKEDIAQTMRRAKMQAVAQVGYTVADVIDLYIEHIKVEEPNPKLGGEITARVESWSQYESVLNRFLRPRLGRMIVSEVSNDDIGALIQDVRDGKVSRKYKASNANARSAYEITRSMFSWAAEAGRRHVAQNPCHSLPKLPPRGQRDRVLTADEIRTLWWGLDRPDLPWPRSVALAMKFQLCTMLRAKEFLKGKTSELVGLGSKDAEFHIPARRAKPRRPIIQPLSSLAQEILAEAIATEDQEFIFLGPSGKPLYDRALTVAAYGKPACRYQSGRESTAIIGIFEFLGMDKWVPHDLRRTPASLAEDLGFSEREIGYCLDHSADKGDDKAARVTRVYARGGVIRKKSRKLETKQKILNAIDEALREIIGTKPVTGKLAA